MGDEEQIDHAAAGVAARQIPLQHLPGFSVFGPGEQAVAVDRTPQGLRFAPQSVDDMVIVDDMDAVAIPPPTGSGVAEHQGAAEKRHAARAHTAMHLCGEALLGFIHGRDEIFDAMQGFSRIQLNLKFGDVEGSYDPAALLQRVADNPRWQFIIQYAKDKQGLLPLLKDIPNHAVLFDESAGRGISPDTWDAPLAGHFCGYAGGLNPDNVAQNLAIIAKVAAGHETWIDMETGVRTNDVFDLAKARRVLEIASPFARPAAAAG